MNKIKRIRHINRFILIHEIDNITFKVGFNEFLMRSRGSINNLDKIKSLHRTRFDIEHGMIQTSDCDQLKKLFNDWTLCQFELQKQWNIPEDKNFHKFWTVPRCTCPELDNEDRYPQGPYVITRNCPVHSEESKTSVDQDPKPITPEDVEKLQKALEVGPKPGLEIVDFPKFWNHMDKVSKIEMMLISGLLIFGVILLIKLYAL